jgi:ElaB/YqjD/DUF883 family membrane-anchored ribosome-binding protein
MDNEAKNAGDDLGSLADDAQALIAATADVAGVKVSEARKRLADALQRSKEIYGRVREKAVEGAKATDRCVHEHPYQAIGIAFGLGAIVGYLLNHRCSRHRD